MMKKECTHGRMKESNISRRIHQANDFSESVFCPTNMERVRVLRLTVDAGEIINLSFRRSIPDSRLTIDDDAHQSSKNNIL